MLQAFLKCNQECRFTGTVCPNDRERMNTYMYARYYISENALYIRSFDILKILIDAYFDV